MNKILVIAAHPDDEVLGMGGTIAKLTKDGNEVNVLIVTDGSSSQYRDSIDLKKITKVSHPLKHQLFSFSFVCLPPYPLTVNTCLTEVMQTIHILRPIFPTL
ncbi:MAG: PIG-L family deacetylase, partial [Bacteroides uniformis]